jgi:galactose oxidase
LEVRPYCCPTASLIEIDGDGHTVSHQWFMISGTKDGDQTGTVEKIDFTEESPRWQKVGDILQPLSTTKAVLLPDGKVLIGHGVNRSENCNVGGRPCTFEEKEGHHFQMFDPATGSVRKLAKTTVSRGLHGTATLLPNGSVFFAGENREALVRPDDPSFPMMTSYAGLLPSGDPDVGVPVGQVFSPPYLFKPDGSSATRPVIERWPEAISYGGNFDIVVEGDPSQIASVALLRSDHNTHSLTTGDRYVKLAFHQKGSSEGRELRVRAAKVPAQAVPGIYMLFVVDKNGVPSEGRRLDIVLQN